MPKTKHLKTIEKELDVFIRHSLIQEKLISKLEQQYGSDSVAAEQYIGLNRIDVVVKNNQEYYFYEVKTANTARDCIRDAFGQLLDYCYYPKRRNAAKIFVVGESAPDSDSKAYLNFTKSEFNIPIDYVRVSL